MALSISTVNVNGVRAAARKGMDTWLDDRRPDVVALQEVRAPEGTIDTVMGPDWHVAEALCATKGRAGVAVASRLPILEVVDHLEVDGAETSGRWVEARIALDEPGGASGKSTTGGNLRGELTVVSAYVHTGDAEVPSRMAEKLAFMDGAIARLAALHAEGRHVLFVGDLNIAHRQVDLKNWRGNVGKAGFLPEEQERLDHLFDGHGWVDLGRHFGGEGPGPYTWWSYRGQAFDNDAGWRIDYLIASPGLAGAATEVVVDRADAYGERWSDHAPVTATFDLRPA